MLGAGGPSTHRIDQAHRIDFSSGFPERFARQFAALSVAGRPVNRTYPARKATLNQIDKTDRLLYFLSASKRLLPVTARPGNARGQRKEPY
jgi:hypothetical protein